MATRRRTSKKAIEQEVAVQEQIRELDDVVLACRDLRHAYAVESHYRPVAVEGGVRGARYLERDRVCMRCPVKMRELFRVHENWLERISSYPVYPKKGYLLHDIPKGTNVIGMVRYEAFKRAIGEAQ